MRHYGRRGMPVEASDGRRFVSVMDAARAIVARDGVGDVGSVRRGIQASIGRGGSAYGLEWRYLNECVGCEFARVPSVCPNHWSWPEYPADACRLKQEVDE